MKNFLMLSAFGLFGCLMFLAGLLGGLTRNQLVLGFFGFSAFLFFIPYIGALMLAFDKDVFSSFMKNSPGKYSTPRSQTLDRIIDRDEVAQAQYKAMHEDDSHIAMKQSDFDRYFLLRLVNDLMDSLLKRPSPN